MELSRLLESNKTLRTIGFDDQSFRRESRDDVGLAGVVCKQTRFDGMVWGHVTSDGQDATAEIIRLLEGGKFLDQLHAILLDGIAFAGFNVVDLAALAGELELPCITVMRRQPDFPAIREALENVETPEMRYQMMREAGPVLEAPDAFFQVRGTDPETARALLDVLTVNGHVPEPLRIAHLVASAVANGESGSRA
jgi:endonuclease V-like protein UPF0215 family